MMQYFAMVHLKATSLTIGNVQLAEDRIPSSLLVFQTDDAMDQSIKENTKWPKTGYVHEAVFYTEAEWPLGQFARQRRRWLNGSFASNIWVINEGLIGSSLHNFRTQFTAWFLTVLSIVQAFAIRYFAVAILTAWLYGVGFILPDVISDPTVIFQPDFHVEDSDYERRRMYAVALGGGYILFYIMFVWSHIPSVVPVNSLSVVRYSEAKNWKTNPDTAFRGPIMYLSVILNAALALSMITFVLLAIVQDGWEGTRLITKVICFATSLPYVIAFLDGMINQSPPNLSTLRGMLYGALGYYPLMIWFGVWLPAYAFARVSDLSWGTRESGRHDESDIAIQRNTAGQRAAISMIASNTILAGLLIFLSSGPFPHVLSYSMLGYTALMAVNYGISVFDVLSRIVWKSYRYISSSMKPTVPRGDVLVVDHDYELMKDDKNDAQVLV